jgi:hypothetical protein
MTRAELVAALRERFAEVRPEFPELAALVRYVSSERLLESHCRCVGCGAMHFTPAELVARAEPVTDIGTFIEAMQALALERVPPSCLRATARRERELLASRN